MFVFVFVVLVVFIGGIKARNKNQQSIYCRCVHSEIMKRENMKGMSKSVYSKTIRQVIRWKIKDTAEIL